MNKPPVAQRLRYAFDNLMARGTIALIGGLSILSLAVVLLASVIIVLTGFRPEEGDRLNFVEAAWESLMRTLDPGTMGGDTGWGFRLVMFGVTLGGLFIISTLIGVISSGIEGKMDDLRKGRSHVIETGHTIILGWSPQIFSIISELVIANQNQPKSCIVILGEKDKVEMEDEIRDRIGSTGRTRIVCRTGDPIDMGDLEIVSLRTAKSIVILGSQDEDPDSGVIKTLLAITNDPNRRPEPYHIVAEIHKPKNMEVARMVGQDEVELILTDELIARIMAQTCRQSGLSVVYTELMDFGGDEIYFQEEPGLVGRTFGEALLAYESSAVIGMHPREKSPQLNPPMDTLIEPGDQIIAISEDDNTVVLSGLEKPNIDSQAICAPQPTDPRPENVLILGWNWRAPIIIRELDHYAPPGSSITVATDQAIEAGISLCRATLKNQTIKLQVGDITDREMLDALPFATTDHVILLSQPGLESQQADARTLVSLLHLRDIVERLDHRFSIVSEMVDVRNRQLAEVTRADDFIVSDKLISLILSQISENKALGPVFTDLFDPEGSEIYLKPAAEYVRLEHPLSFYTVVESARRRGQIALGYRLHAQAEDASKSYGVVVNPDKSATITFGMEDRIILLSEE